MTFADKKRAKRQKPTEMGWHLGLKGIRSGSFGCHSIFFPFPPPTQKA